MERLGAGKQAVPGVEAETMLIERPLQIEKMLQSGEKDGEMMEVTGKME